MRLNAEQQQAVDAAGEAPARVAAPGAGTVEVLLPADDFDWARGLVPDLEDAPRAVDPRDGRAYAVLTEKAYERIKALFEEDPLSLSEQRALLREAGKRAGWDDPELDVYEEHRNRP